ncbi:hypothetical protein NUSPORA_01692 [Nucleospora cyclopteri]
MDAQGKDLYNKIKEKFLHSKLYRCLKNSLRNCVTSSLLLKKEILKLMMKQFYASFKTKICYLEIEATVSTVDQP